jgi:hypothetical protein
MTDKINQLIEILNDPNAEEGEKHDAAMDIGSYPDKRAVDALIKVGSNPNEFFTVLDACGESLAEIYVRLNYVDFSSIEQLTEIAKSSAYAYITTNRPKWISHKKQ